MSWTRKFDAPIALKDGRKLVSLDDARRLMLSLPESNRRAYHWQSAGELLQMAACRDGRFASRAGDSATAAGARGRGSDLGTRRGFGLRRDPNCY